MLERNWKTIRDEALAVMDQNTGHFVPEEENLREKGDWGQYTLWQQGTQKIRYFIIDAGVFRPQSRLSSTSYSEGSEFVRK